MNEYFLFLCVIEDEVCVNSMMSSYMTDSCNCSDSSDIELSDEWGGRKSPKRSRGNRSPKLPRYLQLTNKAKYKWKEGFYGKCKCSISHSWHKSWE